MLLILRIRTWTCESNGHNDSLRFLAMSEFKTISLLAFAKEEESAQRRFIWIRFALLGKLGGFLTLLRFSLVSFRGIFAWIAPFVFPRGIRNEIIFCCLTAISVRLLTFGIAYQFGGIKKEFVRSVSVTFGGPLVHLEILSFSHISPSRIVRK